MHHIIALIALVVVCRCALLIDFSGNQDVSILGSCQLEGQNLGDKIACPGNSTAFIHANDIDPEGRSALHYHRDPHFRRAEVEAGTHFTWSADQRYFIGYEFMITNNGSKLAIFQWKRVDSDVQPFVNIPMHLEFSETALNLQWTVPGGKLQTIASVPVTINQKHNIALAFDTFLNGIVDSLSQNNNVTFWLDGKKIVTTSGLSLWSTATQTYPKFGIYRGEYDGDYDQHVNDSQYIFDSYVYRVQISNSSLSEIDESSGLNDIADDAEMVHLQDSEL